MKVTQRKIAWKWLLFVLLSIGLLATVSAAKSRSTGYQHLQLFARVLAHLERQYVASIDKEEVVIGAIKGLVNTLDPHSAFLTPKEFEIFESDTRGEFGGVGMEVGVRDNHITVISPIPGSPADQAGIEPGDQLIAIDRQSTANIGIDQAIKLMRGVPGTTVDTVFKRPGQEKLIEVTLKRAVIEVESIRADLLLPGFPWIQVRQFQDGTTGELKQAISTLTSKGGGLNGILLDLRRNPGGVLHEAISLSNLFIADGTLLTTRGRGDKTVDTYSARRRGTIEDVPLVVLIDGASASAAEIVAGALQDHGRALIVGTKSFGKGSVQSLIDLGGGYGLKLTVARYFTPNGRSIQAEGITPDVRVESRFAPNPDPDTVLISKMPAEKDLPGHLSSKPKTETPQLTIDDYQLRIAFQLLQGLFAQQRNQSRDR